MLHPKTSRKHGFILEKGFIAILENSEYLLRLLPQHHPQLWAILLRALSMQRLLRALSMQRSVCECGSVCHSACGAHATRTQPGRDRDTAHTCNPHTHAVPHTHVMPHAHAVSYTCVHRTHSVARTHNLRTASQNSLSNVVADRRTHANTVALTAALTSSLADRHCGSHSWHTRYTRDFSIAASCHCKLVRPGSLSQRVTLPRSYRAAQGTSGAVCHERGECGRVSGIASPLQRWLAGRRLGRRRRG